MNYESKLLDLSLLCINIENPRFEMVGNQREAIAQMVDKQNHKITKLAQDIIINRLNPTELILVTPHEKIKGQYNVLEGNRRICALKLMANPELIPEKNKLLIKSFKKLSEVFYRNPIYQIPCVVFVDENEANRWIKLKHTGENEGIGIVPWDAQQKARFEEKIEGKTSYALQVIQFLKNQNIDEVLKQSLSNVPSSSLQRLICDPDFRKIVGIEIVNGKIWTNLPLEEIIKPLIKVIKDLLRVDFTVKDIYFKDDRLNYLGTFKSLELPDKNLTYIDNWKLTTCFPVGQTQNKLSSVTTSELEKKKIYRNTIIPKNLSIPINRPKINKIYLELKNIDIYKFQNSSVILLFIFIELTIELFIEEKKIKSVAITDSLRVKVDTVVNYLEAVNELDKDNIKVIRKYISNKNNILSIDNFKLYVDNRISHTSEEDLMKTWDNIEHFIVKLWNLI